jgi:general secretion pathway protein G
MEIMVVIFIIGLLIAVVAPSVLGNQDKAMKQKVMADLATLEQALDMYRLDNLRFPSSEQGLAALVKSRLRSQCLGPGAVMATCVACRRTRGAPVPVPHARRTWPGRCARWVPMACRVAKARMPTWVTGRCDGASSARLQPDRTVGGTGHCRADDRAGGGRLGNGQASVEQALQRLAVEVRGQAALARHAGQLRGCAGMASAGVRPPRGQCLGGRSGPARRLAEPAPGLAGQPATARAVHPAWLGAGG